MAYTVMSNQDNPEVKNNFMGSFDKKDVSRLRELAKQVMDLATLDLMKERKDGWKHLHDLKPDRPMILFETFSVSGFVTEEELQCSNDILRNIERSMVYNIKQYHELNDDLVIEPYFRLPWKMLKGDYGVTIEEHHAQDSLAYLSNFPIKTPDDLNKLKERDFSVDRDYTYDVKQKIEGIFGDILPVALGNYDNFFSELGFTPFTGNMFIGLTMDLFKLIGNENMMFWAYDHPDAIHRLMRFLCDDRVRFFKWMQSENLLVPNTDNQFGGPSSYGYVSELLSPDSSNKVVLKDLWVWPESQESVTFSPQMFKDFFLGYLAEVSNLFGLSYYGCCEPLDDRIDLIQKAIPNLRTVSISGWNDFRKIGSLLGKNYVHAKKPNPAFISGASPDWERMAKDIKDSFDACPNGNMEVVVRDVYDINGDMKRLGQWVEMTKNIVGR